MIVAGDDCGSNSQCLWRLTYVVAHVIKVLVPAQRNVANPALVITPQPCNLTLNPKPQTLNPKPQTLNTKPQTLNPKPQTLNPKPSTIKPKPQTTKP